jgi:uncharacterized protein (DUF2141 family)
MFSSLCSADHKAMRMLAHGHFQFSIFNFQLIILAFLCFSCAQQAHLTGGDQDVTLPVILNQEPPHLTTAFQAAHIRIYFDEYVELVNPSETFLISPPLPRQPDYVLKGKSLIITLNNELADNTTYIISCNQGIKDLTEGNFLPLTTFVFSTGDYIDSLSLAGCVKNAFTLLPEEKTGVMLYRYDEDSILLKNPPYYYTTTDQQGNFLFSNVAEGVYQLCALSDKNKNYLFDQTDELVAFSSDPVTPVYIAPPPVISTDTSNSTNTDTTATVQDSLAYPPIDYSTNTLWMFEEQDTSLRFLRREFKGNYRHDFIFKNSIEDFQLNQISNKDTLITCLIRYNKTQDTLSVFLTSFSSEPVDFELYANRQLLDTISFNPSQKTMATGRASRRSDTAANYLTYQEITKGELNQSPCILFTSPVQTFDSTRCLLIEQRKDGNDTLPIICSFIDSIKTMLTFPYPYKEKTTYTLLCPDSLFWSWYTTCNDTIAVNFTTKSSKDYGAIRINYQLEQEGNYIVQLLSGDKSDIVQEDFIVSDKSVTYNYLKPAKYRIRVIADANNNKKWDSGKYIIRQQPEKIIYFDKIIDLQPNWKVEETFNVLASIIDN